MHAVLKSTTSKSTHIVHAGSKKNNNETCSSTQMWLRSTRAYMHEDTNSKHRYRRRPRHTHVRIHMHSGMLAGAHAH